MISIAIGSKGFVINKKVANDLIQIINAGLRSARMANKDIDGISHIAITEIRAALQSMVKRVKDEDNADSVEPAECADDICDDTLYEEVHGLLDPRFVKNSAPVF